MTAPWWPTTWGRLAVGDEVQAPDGSAWRLEAGVGSDGVTEWRIAHTVDGGLSWTERRDAEPINARRPTPEPGWLYVDPGAVLELLRATFGDIEIIEEKR